MSDKDNLFDIEKQRKKKENKESPADPTTDIVLNMSDDIDDTLEAYLDLGLPFELVASVLANRLGMLLSAGKAAGAQDVTDLCVDIVLKEASMTEKP